MSSEHYGVILVPDGDGWFAQHPDLPGCVADGDTREEALKRLDVCRAMWIENALAEGLPVPEPDWDPLESEL